MFDHSNRLAPKFPLRMFEAMQIRIDDELRSWPSRPGGARASAQAQPENAPPAAAGAAQEVNLHSAIQALRDVRHLLPPEGVAIADAVLDRSA